MYMIYGKNIINGLQKMNSYIVAGKWSSESCQNKLCCSQAPCWWP